MSIDRITREAIEAIAGTTRGYRITWAPGVYRILEAFDLRDAYHDAYAIAQDGYLSGTLEPAYPVRIEEIETGRAWAFERPAFAGRMRDTIAELEALGIVTEER